MIQRGANFKSSTHRLRMHVTLRYYPTAFFLVGHRDCTSRELYATPNAENDYLRGHTSTGTSFRLTLSEDR